MNETTELIKRCCRISFQELPEEVVSTAKYLLLDYLGVTIRGSQTESAKSAQSLATKFHSATADMAIIGTDIATDPLHAALANGIAAHSIECDDVVNEASLHPAVTVMTTALSAASLAGGCSGKDFISAIVSGYETVIRLGVAVDPASHYARGFHPTATCGTFGSALTAACILKLGETRTVDALGIAGSQAAGSMEYLTDGVYTKRFHAGWAAQSGLTAALLAGEGFTGPKTIIEGKFGFLQGYSDTPRPERLFSDWKNPYKIMKTSIKPHACCRYNQGPIDCLLKITQDNQLAADDIKTATVGVLSAGFALVAEPLEQKRHPATIVDAQFSMPFGAAVAILFGNAALNRYTLENLQSKKVKDLMMRINCVKDPVLDAQYPSKWPAAAEIETHEGRKFTDQIEYPKGDPENPLSGEELKQKFLNMVAPVLALKQAEQLMELVEDFENLIDVRPMIKALALK
jgi:2-methylcitrate dehydratase PrpD